MTSSWCVGTSTTHLSILLALCEGNPPVTVWFHHKGLVMRSFDILFDVCLTRCCTNSPVPGDWRRHDIHMTSLQCISYIRHLSLLHFSKIPAIIRQAWNETMTRFVSFREDDRIIKMMAKVGKCDTLNVISRKELPVASCTKEVNSRLAKRPLVFNGRLANRGLTSLVNRPQLVNEKKWSSTCPKCILFYRISITISSVYICSKKAVV